MPARKKFRNLKTCESILLEMDYDRKEGFSYLDGVSVNISAKFHPPKIVSLPLAFQLSPSTDLLSEEYDFSLERSVLEQHQKYAEEKEAKMSAESNATSEAEIPSTEGTSQPNTITNNPIVSLQSDILQPKLEQPQCKASANNDEKANSMKINLSDFENETSTPFDYMELQTINDLEELSSVFQGLNNKKEDEKNIQSDEPAEDSFSPCEAVGSVSKSISFPLPQAAGIEHSQKFVTSSSGSDFEYGASFYRPNLISNAKTAESGNLSYSFPVISGVNNFHTGSNFAEAVHFPNVSSNYSVLSQVPCVTSHNSRHSIADINVKQFRDAKTSLRGSKSYSDICSLPESGNYSHSKTERACTPPTRMFSPDDTTLVKTIALESDQISPENSSSNGIVNCDSSENYYGLPDPYDELDDNARCVVDSITDMGFSRAQVSRTVKHLGTDDKKVVDHLCQIQMFEESGYDSLEAEAALHLNDYNKEHAKKFMDLVIQFQDLGFEKDAVKKALVQNKNDWDKTIDALLI